MDGLGGRERAEFVNSHVPKWFRGYVFEVASGKGYRGTYLAERIGSDSPHFMNRPEFDRKSGMLAEWRSELGI